MNKPIALLSVFLLMLLSQSLFAGEVIGNTYISEKHGYVELSAPDGQWEIVDTESQGSGAKLAEFNYKTKVNGADVKATLWGSMNPGNVLDADFFLKTVRSAFEEQGATVEPVETKRFAGKKIYFLMATLEQGSNKAHTVVYAFAGNNGFFWLQHVARPDVLENSRPLVEAILEGLKTE